MGLDQRGKCHSEEAKLSSHNVLKHCNPKFSGLLGFDDPLGSSGVIQVIKD